MRRAAPVSVLVFLLALLPAPAWAAEGARLWVTDAHNDAAAPFFADAAVVPGEQLTETLLVHHTGAAGASLELRLDPLTAPNPLETELHLTVSTPAGSTREPLSGLLREERPLDLGKLPAEGPTPVELTVQLPETSGNRTRELVTAFRPVVTAYAPDRPGTTPTEDPGTPAPGGEPGDSAPGGKPETPAPGGRPGSPEPGGAPGSPAPGGVPAAPGTGGGPGSPGSGEDTVPSQATGTTVPGTTGTEEADGTPATGPAVPGTLPHTGLDLLTLVALVVGCGALGTWLVLRARRGTPASGDTQDPTRTDSRA